MKHLTRAKSGFNRGEYETLSRLSTPAKIQDFLDTLPFNLEKSGDTHMSPRRVLREKKAHCIEGALLAAAALWVHGEPPIIMNLSSRMGKGDVDHVVALYARGGRYGAISKTNHAVLRFRDPVYRTPRELALSYFHEWFMNETREKTLECYSKPLDMRRIGAPSGADRIGAPSGADRIGAAWLTAETDLWNVADALAERKHYFLVPKGNWRYVRRADAMELKAGKLIEWK
ncbi:MAG: hypothetical protein B7W98_00440 [Parcubacteria group bacterium 20-58-5]|nr:MAG: hypothetical protein B7W98_00440 [Parcubacteria group bacterium 20-58-5]OYV63812.1 MAG: hypothetical protein B7X03_00025 [Parcubacteria group bacterium 21-58-10]HQT82885.1 hypothetical protein [Candidatus Paceibacterota bacterium]